MGLRDYLVTSHLRTCRKVKDLPKVTQLAGGKTRGKTQIPDFLFNICVWLFASWQELWDSSF